MKNICCGFLIRKSTKKSGEKLIRDNNIYKDDRNNRERQNSPVIPMILMFPAKGIFAWRRCFITDYKSEYLFVQF